jgi:predicted DNA-binding protein (MmcQ/YjbR family)
MLNDGHMPTRKAASLWDSVRSAALDFPEAHEDFPWGESVMKVRKKVFVFLGSSDPANDPTIGLKLAESVDHARSLAGSEPMAYGLGPHGWTRVPLNHDVGLELILDWVEESYRLVAPKTLARQLDSA